LHLHRHLCRGYTDVVDADLSRYFDSIPHSELLKSVARRVVDRNVLRLIKMRLKAPTEERDGSDGHRPQAPAPIFDLYESAAVKGVSAVFSDLDNSCLRI